MTRGSPETVALNASYLEDLHTQGASAGARGKIAVVLLEALLAYCQVEGIELYDIDKGCQLCGLLDEAWRCPECKEAIPKSKMLHASADSPMGHQHKDKAPFLGFCPKCRTGRTVLPMPEPEVEA